MGGFAWVTLATNDSYSLGALVVANSLKQVGTAHQLAILVTPGVSNAMREKLALTFNVVQEVNILDSRDESNLRLLKRPELGVTFTKLHCWRLTQFEKCVFLDADTLVLQNCDELFEREELSAAPDVGWPDCFNSGVFVYRPSLDTYDKLIQFAIEKGSFDGGDQGLLNLYFSDWAHKDISKHLPFIYNMCSTACYSYLPAYKQFGANAKIVHFIGSTKPWLQYFNTETKKVQPSGEASHLQEVLQRWWDIFCSLIHPHLSPAMLQGQLQDNASPSYFPPQYAPPSNYISSADDYENEYDPWDEYDRKIAQNTHNTSVSTTYIHFPVIDSVNTNAYVVADHTTIHSQSQSHNTYSAQNDSCFQPPPFQSVVHVQPHRTPTYTPPLPKSHHQQHNYHQEQHPQNHQEHHAHYHQEQHNHHYHPEPIPDHHSPKEIHYHDHHSQEKAELIHSSPERPKSPDRPNPTPVLPNECEATTTASNDMTLNTNLEDISNQQEDAGLAGAFAQLTLGVPRTAEQDALENVLRKQSWEVGNIDYLGRDSFDNIWSKISETLSTDPARVEPSSEDSAPAQSQISAEETKPVEPPVISPPTPISSETSKTDSPPIETVSSQEPVLQASLETSVPQSSLLASKPTEVVQSKVVERPEVESIAASPVESAPVVVQSQAKELTPPGKIPTETLPEVSKVPESKEQVCVKPTTATPEVDTSKLVKAAVDPSTPQIQAVPQNLSPESESSVIQQKPVEATQTPAESPKAQQKPAPTSPETPKTTASPTSPSPKPMAPSTPSQESTSPIKEAFKEPQPSKETPKTSGITQVPKDSPKTKVTEATPPATPGTPPITSGSPLIEKTKQALVAETSIPETPPPTEGGSTPTPPPRKTDKPKKVAAKPKK